MPMPRPRDGEARAAFVDRCMGDGVMNHEYPDGGQRLAVCNRIWMDRDKETTMSRGILCAPMEIKQLDEQGSFEGLASVYGNVDLGGDVVEPGAFKEFVKTRDGMIRILDGHNTRQPIGKGEVSDTDKGLAIKGRLNLAVARAREVYELMKDHIIDGLSIGYDILPGGADITEAGIRRLKALKLWEVSTTPFPMNPAAQVSAVKAVEPVRSVRELEDLLREAAGLSRAQAKLHAGAIWKTVTGQRDADGEVVRDEVRRVAEEIASLGKSIND